MQAVVFVACLLIALGGCKSATPLAGAADAGVAMRPDTAPDAACPPAPQATDLRVEQRQWPPARPGYRNPIVDENLRPGTPMWSYMRGINAHEIEGYANRTSARAGAEVQFMFSTNTPHTATWSLLRLGWYGGAGAREVAHGGPIELGPQPACPMDPSTGLVKCAWSPSLTVTLAPDLVSGLYVLRMVRDDAYGRFVPLVITDDRPADLLFQSSVTTHQAYNAWGGASLYADSTGTVRYGRAVRVSFDRPYEEGNGSGQLLGHEAHFASFLERYGYDVTYTTNLEVSRGGTSLLRDRGAFLSIGHDEYWDLEERMAVEGARNIGVPLLSFGANAAYWKIRLEDGGAEGNPRTMTCYKLDHADDPIQGRNLTGLFRSAPICMPENALFGVMYDNWTNYAYPWVVKNSWHFLYKGTGLLEGDVVPLLVGFEADRTFDNGFGPKSYDVVARSPLADALGKPGWSEAITYRAKTSGALVFAAGTIDWSDGLDRRDARVERMTANLIEAAVKVPVPEAIGSGSALPSESAVGPFASSVTTVVDGLDSPTALDVLTDGSLAVTDASSHRVFHVGPPPLRTVKLLAGDGVYATPATAALHDGVPGREARFNTPTSILADPDGNLIVADTGDNCIRMIMNDGDRTVVTVAGSMKAAGNQDGIGTQARFHWPTGLVLVPHTRNLLVADEGNHRVRSIDLDTWEVSTIAGTSDGALDGPGSEARFSYPTALAVDELGRIFVVSSRSAKIAVIDVDSKRTVTTLAGHGAGFTEGPGFAARLGPQSGALWHDSALLVADPVNNRVRCVIPGTDARTTMVHTFAGSGLFGASDGPGELARFGLPLGLAKGPDGAIYLADPANGAIRAIHP